VRFGTACRGSSEPPIFLITPRTILIDAKQFSKYRVKAAWGSHFFLGSRTPNPAEHD
jgi:hypothetical protein